MYYFSPVSELRSRYLLPFLRRGGLRANACGNGPKLTGRIKICGLIAVKTAINSSSTAFARNKPMLRGGRDRTRINC